MVDVLVSIGHEPEVEAEANSYPNYGHGQLYKGLFYEGTDKHDT